MSQSDFFLCRIVAGMLLVFSAVFGQSNFEFPTSNHQAELIPVSIQGAGVAAGTYYVRPALRVFDIIKMAAPQNAPDLRTIDCRAVITTTHGVPDTLDLLRYLSGGDHSQNPFIQAGMSIRLGYATRFVSLQGEIQGTVVGKVPLAAGETAGEFLSLYTFTSAADTEHILLFRDGQGIRQYSLDKIATVELADNDFITVLPGKDIPRHASVRVSGEASSPGTYPIIHGTTPLAEILDRAGGASHRGDMKRAYLLRKAKVRKNTSDAFLAGQNNVRPEVTGGFKYLTASRDYAVIPASQTQTLLEDGDEIVVPPVEHCVYVSGCVKKPGAYPYEKGKSSEYYVKLAGGCTRSADKRNIKVITPFTDDAFSISVPRHLAAGDIVMVPEAQEDKWIKRWSPVISAVATVISSVSIVVSFTR